MFWGGRPPFSILTLIRACRDEVLWICTAFQVELGWEG